MWTYKCVNQRCVRQHHSDNKIEKRIPFTTCSMLCGSYTKIWPEPTKSFIGISANSFSLNDIQFKIKTPFKNVEGLLESAFSIFLEEIKTIIHSFNGKIEELDRKSSTAVYGNHINKEHPSTHKSFSSHRRHNLTNFNIFVYVLKTSDIHLTFNTDECYNLTMISESILYK